MATLRAVPLFLVLLLPTAARPTDAPLHVDPSVEECSIRFAPELSQTSFRRFAREFGSVSAFKQGGSPATLGRGGVAFDAQYASFSIDDRDAAWNDTFTHPDADHFLGATQSFPKLRLRVGVTDDVDVGAFYTESPQANYGWLGVEAKVGLLRQRDDVPVTLAVRGAYTKTLWVADMNMHAFTADVTVGRTFWKVITPYVAVGGDAVLVRETSRVVDLEDEAVVVPHATVGVEARVWRLAFGAEAQLSAITSYQAQVSVLF